MTTNFNKEVIYEYYKRDLSIRNALYPSIQMSTNLSRESRFASVLWLEGCPYTLKELNDLWEQSQKEKDSKQRTYLKNCYKEAVMANTIFIEKFFGLYFTPEENAVQVCKDMFNFPDFDDMDKIVLN